MAEEVESELLMVFRTSAAEDDYTVNTHSGNKPRTHTRGHTNTP